MALAVLALVLTAADNPWLERARASYERLDCEKALEELQLAAAVPTNTAAATQSILDYTGRCQIALGRRSDAERTFTRMLELDPATELPESLSPKILESFQKVKRQLYPAGFVALERLPGVEGVVRVRLVDPYRRVARVVLGRWSAEQRRFVESELPRDEGGMRVGSLDSAGTWYVEARDEADAALHLLGDNRPPAPTPSAAVEVDPRLGADSPSRAFRVTAVVALAIGAAALATAAGLFISSRDTRRAAEQEPWADAAFAGNARANLQVGWSAGLLGASGAFVLAGVMFLRF